MEAYPQAMRVRVLAAIQDGETTSEIAERLTVSPAWVRRFHQRYRATGTIAPLVRRTARVGKLDHRLDDIRRLLQDKNDLTLEEIRRELALDVALSTLWAAVRKLELTFKKKRSTPPNKSGPTSSKPDKRGPSKSCPATTTADSSSSTKPTPTPSSPAATATPRAADAAMPPSPTATTSRSPSPPL